MKWHCIQSLVVALLFFSGCASIGKPKLPTSLAKLPVPKLSSTNLNLNLNLNPFAKKAKQPDSTTETANLPANRGFRLEQVTNPLLSGPGVTSMIMGTSPDARKSQASLANAKQYYSQAQKADGELRTKLFEQAGPNFVKAANRAVGGSVQEEARFLAGESYFFADEYPDAVESYGKLTKEFPNTRYMDTVDKRRFGIAHYWIEVNKQDAKYDVFPNFTNGKRPVIDAFGNATKLYDRIRYDNPNGKLADDATMAAAVAHFERGRFGEANILFDDLRQNFPSSEHHFQAYFLGLKAKMNIYEGPEYDGTVLDEAEDLCRGMMAAFPSESQEHREFIENALKDVKLRKAEREYTVAKYYDRRNEYGAAEMHYEHVAEQFGNTNLANDSRDRIEQIEDLPRNRETSLQWLADAFPKADNPKPLLSRDANAPVAK